MNAHLSAGPRRTSEYLMHVRHAPRELFVRAYPNWFLWSVLRVDGTKADAGADFDTDLVRAAIPEEIHTTLHAGPEIYDADLVYVYKLAKSQGAPSQGHINLGRATTNDIAVPHMSVSKLHACFFARDGSMFMKDMGSSNGTRINGQIAAAGKSMSVKLGDTVSFGRTNFQIFDAGRLYDLLSSVRFRPEEAETALSSYPPSRLRP